MVVGGGPPLAAPPDPCITPPQLCHPTFDPPSPRSPPWPTCPTLSGSPRRPQLPPRLTATPYPTPYHCRWPLPPPRSADTTPTLLAGPKSPPPSSVDSTPTLRGHPCPHPMANYCPHPAANCRPHPKTAEAYCSFHVAPPCAAICRYPHVAKTTHMCQVGAARPLACQLK